VLQELEHVLAEEPPAHDQDLVLQADLFEARAAEVREEEFYGAREGAEDLRWAAASLREELTPTATPGSTPR